MSETEHYSIAKPTTSLFALLDRTNKLNEEINKLKPNHPDLWPVIEEKLRVDWTYDSNAIEGSSLTRGETLFFLQEGLTIAGKPFKDFLDAHNHAEAIDFLFETIQRNRSITPGLIKEINALLLAGINHTRAMDRDGNTVRKAATPGQYKKQPNHVLQRNGTIHHYVAPIHVTDEIESLCTWIGHNMEELHPVVCAAIAHYNFVRIHPFDDGNGRGARILMNLILMQQKLPPAVIKVDRRHTYLETLSKADTGDKEPFIEFVAESIVETLEVIVRELKDAESRNNGDVK